MSIPFGVSHNRVAQTNFGIAARDTVGDIFPNALAAITFGFLLGNFWALCDTDASTTWTPVSDESTTWTGVSDASTTWSECT